MPDYEHILPRSFVQGYMDESKIRRLGRRKTKLVKTHWNTLLLVALATPPTSKTLTRAESIFDFVTLLVPKRLADEEIGDALEVIQKEIAADRPRWLVRLRVGLKVTSTLFWISINAVRYAKGAFSKAKSGSGERSS